MLVASFKKKFHKKRFCFWLFLHFFASYLSLCLIFFCFFVSSRRFFLSQNVFFFLYFRPIINCWYYFCLRFFCKMFRCILIWEILRKFWKIENFFLLPKIFFFIFLHFFLFFRLFFLCVKIWKSFWAEKKKKFISWLFFFFLSLIYFPID